MKDILEEPRPLDAGKQVKEINQRPQICDILLW